MYTHNLRNKFFLTSGRDELDLGLARIDDDDANSLCSYAGDASDAKSSVMGADAEDDGPADPNSTEVNRAIGRLDDSLRLIKSGYLWRLSSGGDTDHKWSRRWFVLRADACLYFFKTENVSRANGWKELKRY